MSDSVADFAADTERFRRELLAHCYRMVGSPHDAEDLVQETYLRAWRSYDRFEHRASVRSWLYRIATNVCLTASRTRPVRVLPSGLTGTDDGVSWLEPLPDAWIGDPAWIDDPATTVVTRESLRLALIAGLQHLPARQRAILLLRDVLAFSAVETAEILGTTTAAVKSGLHRARTRLDELRPHPEELLEPSDPRARALLEAYITAFEHSDAALLETVLRADATLEATPFRDWQSGRADCIHLLATHVLGAPGDWRLTPTAANGHPAAVVHHRSRPDGVVVLEATPTGVSRVIKFHDPTLVAVFAQPRTQNSLPSGSASTVHG
ncbi:RNA polymerase subunit sigma-70 [Cryptosporangium sp. NPDC048952]|uniref:RNA polymerase subunit sigma-70 n=1 Tax=Cryptosporangium sp. NPDC048952 TaxID=3363961 RepID=UPI003717681D